MDFRKLISELARRNVFRAVVAYLAVAWVVVQIASTVFPAFDAPPILLKGLIYLLAIGLIFWIGFAWVYDLTPDGLRRTGDAVEDSEIRDSNTRRLNRVIVGAVVCAVLLLVGASFWAGSRWADPGSADSTVRIAVIPLETESEAAEEAFWGEGMTETLIEELSRSGELLVLSMASSRYFEAGIQPTIELFARETEDVDFFVYGRVVRRSNRLEVNVSVSRKLEGDPVWEDAYGEDLSEVRRLWARVAADIRKVTGPAEVVTNRSHWQDLKPVRPETYELYLKGKYYLNKSTVEDWQRGLVYLQEAIDRNPADPDAYAGMAEGYITWGHSLMPPPDVFPKAEAAAKRAIQLDSANAAGWAALSQYHTYYGWDWELADYAFRKADELNPNLAMNHYHRAWYLALFGRMDEAIAEHVKAQKIDPFSALHTGWLGGLYNMVGEYDKALEEAHKTSKMNDDDALSKIVAGRAYLQQGLTGQGIDTLRAAARINSGWKYLVLAPVLIRNGFREEGFAIARELESRDPTAYYSLCLAQIYYADGNFDAAFRWLESARGHAFYPWTVRVFFSDPAFQADPRFDALIQELNLPPPGPLMYEGREITLSEVFPY